jgi:hypothetical protein
MIATAFEQSMDMVSTIAQKGMADMVKMIGLIVRKCQQLLAAGPSRLLSEVRLRCLNQALSCTPLSWDEPKPTDYTTARELHGRAAQRLPTTPCVRFVHAAIHPA